MRANLQYVDGGQITGFMLAADRQHASALDQFTRVAGVTAAGRFFTLPGTTDKSTYDGRSIMSRPELPLCSRADRQPEPRSGDFQPSTPASM